MFKQASILALAVGVLAGCASTHTQEQINYAASIYYFSNTCSQEGLMDKDTAAKGIAWARSSIYESETSQAVTKVKEYAQAQRSTNKATCDDLALRIRTQEQVEIGNARRAVTQPTYSTPLPTTTNCYTVEGWTRCTTN